LDYINDTEKLLQQKVRIVFGSDLKTKALIRFHREKELLKAAK
jgi:hypothetical protein